MARRIAAVTPSDVTRFIKAAVAAGVSADRVAGMKITRDGVTVLFCDQASGGSEPANSWDEVLG